MAFDWAEYAVVYESPIAWGEMDALGHVNNIYYFRFFESARAEYFRKVGIWEYGEKHGIGVILHSTSCRFRRPLEYPDRVQIATRVVELLEDRFKMEYGIFSSSQQAIVAEGEGLIVSYDYRQKRKCPLPDEIRQSILKIEGGRLS